MRHNCSSMCLLCLVIGARGLSAATPPVTVQFTAEVNQRTTVTGIPLLLRMTLRNDGQDAYRVIGQPGWGRGVEVLVGTEGGELQALQPDVRHLDTDLGARYKPVYFFGGTLAAGATQHVLQMIDTGRMKGGVVRVKAVVIQGAKRIESPEVSVRLLEAPAEDVALTLDEQIRGPVFRWIPSLHNHPGATWQWEELSPLLLKAVTSKGVTIDCEYALYAAALQTMPARANLAQCELAEHAAREFLERFPHSWLRAHVCAALFRTYVVRALAAMEAGAKIPEAQPLFDNLGIKHIRGESGDIIQWR